MEHSFIGRVITDRRVTIPKEICDLAGIKEGDYVQMKVMKIEKEEM
jgi:AbrB family looped-hinge helix DNA binding protein